MRNERPTGDTSFSGSEFVALLITIYIYLLTLMLGNLTSTAAS
jgi:hypothetical protein